MKTVYIFFRKYTMTSMEILFFRFFQVGMYQRPQQGNE